MPAHEAFGLDLVGAFRVAMVNDSEAIVIWAVPDWATWAGSSRPGSGRRDDADLLAGWRKATLDLGADWQRTLLVDAPLAPLRIGRQPAVVRPPPPRRALTQRSSRQRIVGRRAGDPTTGCQRRMPQSGRRPQVLGDPGRRAALLEGPEALAISGPARLASIAIRS